MKRVQVDLRRIASKGDEGGGDSVGGRFVDEVDLLRMRSDILGRADRAFLRMYLEKGSRITEIAQMVGISEAAVARRIKKLTKRLLDGRYVACMRNRDKLCRLDRHIAKDYLIEGLSMEKIAARRRVTVYRVRQAVGAINDLLRVEKCRY